MPPVAAEHLRALLGYRQDRAGGFMSTTLAPSDEQQHRRRRPVVDRGVGPADYRGAKIDAISGALFACVIAITIIVATGAVIGGQGPLQSAKQAAQALRPVAGSGAELLFAFGLLGASALAGTVVPLSSSYAISEAVGSNDQSHAGSGKHRCFWGRLASRSSPALR